MAHTAILIDGGYFRKKASHHWGQKTPKERADELVRYCYMHIGSEGENELYRIFYYDCPPLDKQFNHPLTNRVVDFRKSETFKWTNDFYKELKKRRKFALRMGTLAERKDAIFKIKQASLRRLINGALKVEDLTEEDFEYDFGQKGVDMKIGLDIASLAHKKLVNQIILIAGDSDFVPAAKHARREGIDFILDPMGQKVTDDLFEHIDGMQSHWREMYPKKSAQTEKPPASAKTP